ncbi:DNA-processing protein DprA [Spiractinospora alimapuensis]|uniref:DNA-processing protein DprA n=1 Tax=Spiractinospora alimapuensis TaxID=2820884 RepID=UPI001EEB2EA9|nr:DNA-processing protein DprA [Spiractinospora alimapuensis]QVQ51680.1 DNA-processing protein DprA [Spiractinospora alimapuensis]
MEERQRDDEIEARLRLSLIAGPTDPVLGRLLRRYGHAREVWRAVVTGDRIEPPGDVDGRAFSERLRGLIGRARRVTDRGVAEARDRAGQFGARVVVPGDPEWPTRLESLGTDQPYLLWVRGNGDLRNACLRSAAVIGARAATDYGMYVAAELGYGLAERGWTTVSGGAFGIDAQAHRGALSAGGCTVSVLACGPDIVYPRSHERLFDEIVGSGVLVSELPPGRTPRRHSFLVRNRLIAALTPGTVVVEAGRRSGAMNTAHHAENLHRPVMAVPGPVTSSLSAGCHHLLRDWQAVCVRDAADIVDLLGELDNDVLPAGRPRADPLTLGDSARAVLAHMDETHCVAPATLALRVGCDVPALLRELGLLAAGGLVERSDEGWRRTR